MKLLDQQELISQKRTNAKVAVIPNQAEINQDTNTALSGLKAQMDAPIEQQAELTSAMSVIGQQSVNQDQIPACVQTIQNNTPVTQAQCNRQLNDLQVAFGKQLDAMQGRGSSNNTAITSASSPNSSHAPNESRNELKDDQGRSWFQVKFFCSKHGFNTAHSNEACKFKQSPKGHPWIAGATIQDPKGGNMANADKLHPWHEKSTKQYANQVPT